MSHSRPPGRAPAFGVLVPVKPPDFAKSRLAPLGEPTRRALASAFALDTVAAALESPRVGVVLAVTDDHRLARELSRIGAQVLPDGVADDLNGSLCQAAAELVRRGGTRRVAALCADLPALRTEDLTVALEAAVDAPLTFVADHAGRGTTLLAARDLAHFTPAFGPASRAGHLAAGGREVTGPALATLRRDVDTPDDLRAAVRLGVGPRTARVVAEAALGS